MALDRGPLEALNRLLATDLTGATVEELAEYFRQVEAVETTAKGKAIAAMRATGASWRTIAKITGKPQSTIRFWYGKYLESQPPAE